MKRKKGHKMSKKKGRNPNRFPEETKEQQRDLPYEGDDKGAVEGR